MISNQIDIDSYVKKVLKSAGIKYENIKEYEVAFLNYNGVKKDIINVKPFTFMVFSVKHSIPILIKFNMEHICSGYDEIYDKTHLLLLDLISGKNLPKSISTKEIEIVDIKKFLMHLNYGISVKNFKGKFFINLFIDDIYIQKDIENLNEAEKIIAHIFNYDKFILNKLKIPSLNVFLYPTKILSSFDKKYVKLWLELSNLSAHIDNNFRYVINVCFDAENDLFKILIYDNNNVKNKFLFKHKEVEKVIETCNKFISFSKI